MDDEEFRQMVDRKRTARMFRVDMLPKDTRDLVNEYGLTVIDTLLQRGITKPKHMRHVVETILNELSPSRGSFSRQGVRTEVNR